MRIALTGPPGCGKTSFCLELFRILSPQLKIGGMITREIRQAGIRMGFQILDLISGRTGILAHVSQPSGPRVGKYRVNLADLESLGVDSILNAVQRCELVIIDELGPMELSSAKFIAAVEHAIQNAHKLLVTLHYRAQHPLLEKVRSEFELHQLNPGNRAQLLKQLKAAFSADH